MSEAEQLADAVSAFLRGFGLHRPEHTPCGFEAGVADAHALRELAAGPLRQAELVVRLGLTKSTVSRLVDGLVERGWAERQAVAADGRGVLVALTSDGDHAAHRLARSRAARMRALLDAVPDDRRRDVIDVLRLLEEAARASDPRQA